MKRCGNSRRCYPADTICDNERNESNSRTKTTDERRTRKNKKSVSKITSESVRKIKKHERRRSWKAVAAGAIAVTVAGASLGYIMTKKKEILPKPMDFESGNAPEGMKKYDGVISNPMPGGDTTARGEVDAMFERKSIRQRQQSGEIGTPVQGKYDDKTFKSSMKEVKKENRRKAQQWAHEALSDPDTVILDLETTGLMRGVDPYTPETWKKQRGNVPGIVQIGMVDTELNSVDVSLNPEKRISKEAAAVIGRDPKEFMNQPNFKEYYPVLKKRLEGKRVLAFNARFDLQVIDALCIENDLPLIEYKNRPKPPTVNRGKVQWNMPSVMDNDADVMHFWGLYLGKNMAPSMYGGNVDFNKGLAYASLPTLKNAKAHDATADCFSTYDVLRIMAKGATPNLSDLKEKERKAWLESQ